MAYENGENKRQSGFSRILL